MKLRKISQLMLLTFLAAFSVSSAEEGDEEIEEEKSDFDSFLKAYTATWNTHDGDALGTFFTSDADLMMGNLPRIVGREAIGGWWNTYFSRIDEGRKGEFELISQRDIVPGAKLVNVSSKTFGAKEDGEELETRLARGTWVVVKRNEAWRIAAMRGLPAEGDQRERPGTDR